MRVRAGLLARPIRGLPPPRRSVMTVVRRRPRTKSVWFVALACLGALGFIATTRADGPRAKEKGTSSKTSASASSARTTGARLDFVDRMIRESWAGADIKPSRIAGDDEFMRRAYL